MTNETALLEAQKRVESFKEYANGGDLYLDETEPVILENAQSIALIAIDTEMQTVKGSQTDSVSIGDFFKLQDLQLIKEQIPNTI